MWKVCNNKVILYWRMRKAKYRNRFSQSLSLNTATYPTFHFITLLVPDSHATKVFSVQKSHITKGFFCTRHMKSYNKEFPSWNIITMKNYWRQLDTWESWVVTSYNMIKQRNIQIYISWQFLYNIVPPSKQIQIHTVDILQHKFT